MYYRVIINDKLPTILQEKCKWTVKRTLKIRNKRKILASVRENGEISSAIYREYSV